MIGECFGLAIEGIWQKELLDEKLGVGEGVGEGRGLGLGIGVGVGFGVEVGVGVGEGKESSIELSVEGAKESAFINLSEVLIRLIDVLMFLRTLECSSSLFWKDSFWERIFFGWLLGKESSRSFSEFFFFCLSWFFSLGKTWLNWLLKLLFLFFKPIFLIIDSEKESKELLIFSEVFLAISTKLTGSANSGWENSFLCQGFEGGEPPIFFKAYTFLFTL